MLIPNNQRKINQYKVPYWAVGMLITFFIISVVYISYLYIDLKQTRANLENLKYVENINNLQAKKISELIDKTKVMEEKISEIEYLDKQVRELVGLEKDEEDFNATEDETIIPVSSAISKEKLAMLPRGGASRYTTKRLEDNLELLDLLIKDVDYLNNIAELQQDNLTELQVDVKEQLAFLAAKPNKWPVKGKITSRFGYRQSPFGTGRREFHDGIDIAASYGTYISAAGDGKVIFSGWQPGFGRVVGISHGYGYTTYYAHNSVNLVKVGDRVQKGDRIARVGTTGRTTGAHVHFSIEYKGKKIDPLTVLK